MSCGNNLKQIGLALHNYHDAFKSFPYGERKGEKSPNWRFSLLPFMEQNNVYDRADINASFSAPNYGTNADPFTGLIIDTYRCPSSAAPANGGDPVLSNTQNGQLMDYVGISGAISDGGTFTATNKCSGVTSHGGIHCNNGTLVALEAFKMAGITDGTSNTLIVAEQSGMVRDSAGLRLDTRANYRGGWSGFGGNGTDLAAINKLPDAPTGARVWGSGTTTVRYAINFKGDINASFYRGANSPWDANTILNSFHAAGIQTVRADGSVHYLSDTTDFLTIRKLASKDDGLVISE